MLLWRGAARKLKPLESTRNLDKVFGAGVKAPDIVGCIDDPDAVPASRDLRGTSRHHVERAAEGITAQDLVGAVDSPYIIHPHGDLCQAAWNLDELLLSKTVMEDLGVDEPPYVGPPGCDLSQGTTCALVELA
jgi:hypothetical protein